MELEEKVKLQLLARGFTKELLLNNRGLIGAAIDETILELVKNLNIPYVSVAKRKVCFNENCYHCHESTLTCKSINYLQCSKKQTSR